jgi:hypothetical protein
MLSTLLYAPQPWIRRRVDYSAGLVRVDVISARLRERLATNPSRMADYFQWLVDRGIVTEFRRERSMFHVVIRVPTDHGA